LEPCAAGEVRALDVRVTNLGSEVWPHGSGGLPELRLAYRGLPSALRTPLPHDLAPGEATLVPVVVEAPEEPGRHPFTLDVVHERHRWFECGAELELEVLPRRRAIVLVGQPPGEAAFDERVDELLASLDPSLEPGRRVACGRRGRWRAASASARKRTPVPARRRVPRRRSRPARVLRTSSGA